MLLSLASSRSAEDLGPDGRSVQPEEAQELRERPVERRGPAVRRHLRARCAVEPPFHDPPHAHERREVQEDDRVRGVEPDVRRDPAFLQAVGDPGLALHLPALQRFPLGIRRRDPARLPIQPVEMDDREVEGLRKLASQPGLARSPPSRGGRCAARNKGWNSARSRARAHCERPWVYPGQREIEGGDSLGARAQNSGGLAVRPPFRPSVAALDGSRGRQVGGRARSSGHDLGPCLPGDRWTDGLPGWRPFSPPRCSRPCGSSRCAAHSGQCPTRWGRQFPRASAPSPGWSSSRLSRSGFRYPIRASRRRRSW